MNKPLKVGFLSAQNYLDKNTFSGTLYYMNKALERKGIQLVNLGRSKTYFYWRKQLNRIWKKPSNAEPNSSEYNAKYKKFASLVQNQLKEASCDLIFSPVASAEVSFLETATPIIFLSDATPKIYNEHYQLNLSSEKLEFLNQQELNVVAKSKKLVYSSQWAANSALQDYHAAASKIEVIPFGANIDNAPSVKDIFLKCQASRCRLLFVGKDWQRKGGNIAFQTLLSVLNKGLDAELVIIGCTPPADIQHEKLTIIPYLDKNIPQQREQLNQLFLESHFFIFPTRADCSPIVICEANAFGLPVLTTDVGGIPTIIKEGKNGYMLPLSASSDHYADLVVKNFSNKSIYEQLVKTAREEYDTRLNWDKWAENIHQVMLNLCN
jgi:glycosyltransferase involved in cell wall biosynthesis